MNEDSEARDGDLEWESRVLCSDESCIGTIGPDGRCRECGRPYEGVLPGRTSYGPTQQSATASDEDSDASDESHAAVIGQCPASDATDENSGAATDDEWESRTLCPDESCIGIIGPEGRCKECGRSL